MLVEEIPKTANANSSTVYFSSSINLTARSNASRQLQAQDQDPNANKKGRAKVNYNVNSLMNAQTSAGDTQVDSGPLKSAQQIQLERIVSRRVVDLNKEGSVTSFELPKNFGYTSIHASSKKSKLGNTPTTKKILSARRNLNSYFEEERNLISINTILGLNFQFITDADGTVSKGGINKNSNNRRLRPKLRLCCICGTNSSYARCSLCGLFSCSVRCNNLHNESRCI